jgi:hypothetical protein
MIKEVVYRGMRKIDESRQEYIEIKALIDDEDISTHQIWSDIEQIGQKFFDFDDDTYLDLRTECIALQRQINAMEGKLERAKEKYQEVCNFLKQQGLKETFFSFPVIDFSD